MTLPTPLPPTDESGSQPRPTQAAFEPVTKPETWRSIGFGFFCLLAMALGGGAWFDPSLIETQTLGSPGLGGLVIVCLPFVFPIFLPLAGYFWWLAWRDWRQSRAFEAEKQVTQGTITHLWIDPPRPPGRHYYVGYRFGEGHSAYQKVHALTYKRLTVGDRVTVEYSPPNPHQSRIDLKKSSRRRADRKS